jgi:ABC-type sulfate transport system substrate-binding protein
MCPVPHCTQVVGKSTGWLPGKKAREQKIQDAALAYTRAVFDNVVVQPRDAREASDVFYKQRVGGSGRWQS